MSYALCTHRLSLYHSRDTNHDDKVTSLSFVPPVFFPYRKPHVNWNSIGCQIGRSVSNYRSSSVMIPLVATVVALEIDGFYCTPICKWNLVILVGNAYGMLYTTPHLYSELCTEWTVILCTYPVRALDIQAIIQSKYWNEIHKVRSMNIFISDYAMQSHLLEYLYGSIIWHMHTRYADKYFALVLASSSVPNTQYLYPYALGVLLFPIICGVLW